MSSFSSAKIIKFDNLLYTVRGDKTWNMHVKKMTNLKRFDDSVIIFKWKENGMH